MLAAAEILTAKNTFGSFLECMSFSREVKCETGHEPDESGDNGARVCCSKRVHCMFL